MISLHEVFPHQRRRTHHYRIGHAGTRHVMMSVASRTLSSSRGTGAGGIDVMSGCDDVGFHTAVGGGSAGGEVGEVIHAAHTIEEVGSHGLGGADADNVLGVSGSAYRSLLILPFMIPLVPRGDKDEIVRILVQIMVDVSFVVVVSVHVPIPHPPTGAVQFGIGRTPRLHQIRNRIGQTQSTARISYIHERNLTISTRPVGVPPR
mmetsp:Transcript_61176/g.180938  ORF Transcript_61176/g.180938 Transcript_61176/m.180938 type:complete len:205 (+) Transcript_61176:1020-1634(+)